MIEPGLQSASPEPKSTGATPLSFLGGVLVAALATWVAVTGTWLTTDTERVIAAILLTLGLVIWGLRTSRKRLGHFDLVHPLSFSLIYTAVAFIAPIWFAVVLQSPYGALRRREDLYAETIGLMVLGVLGFAVGAMLRFREPRNELTVRPAPGFLQRGAGRLMILPVIVWNALDILAAGVTRVGEGQTEQTISGTVGILVGFLFLVGTLLILVGNKLESAGVKMLTRVDVLLLFGALVSQALTGRRSDAVAVMLLVIIFSARSRKAFLYVGAGTAAILGFAVWGVRYRSAASGLANSNPALDLILGDLANISFTTGATAAVVPDSVAYFNGSTIFAAVLRQLPGPLADLILGPPGDTGTYVFRDLIDFSNANNGVGYSLPAEGYLNFGMIGLFGMCFAVGGVTSWAYARFRPQATRAIHVLYPLFLANLPAAWRSDLLSGIKATLYPLLIYWFLTQLIRIINSDDDARRGSSRRATRRAVK